MCKEDLVRLIEAEKSERGYEFIIRNEKYLSEIDADILAEYAEITSDIMRHIAELVEDSKITAADITDVCDQIDEEYPEKDEEEKVLFIVMRARSQGLIDEYFDRCIQKLTALKGWPVDSATHLLIERPKVMSYIFAAMDRYVNKYEEEDENFAYDVSAYWLIRQLISGDPRTQYGGYVPGDQI